MTYILLGVASAYLILGYILSRTVLNPRRGQRMKFRDVFFGSLFMPILAVVFLILILWEDFWAWLLKVLDFDPPEEMRAGPLEKPGRDSDV